MKKALMVSTIAPMIGLFNMGNLSILKDLGYEVHVACNFDCGSTWSGQRAEEFKRELKEKKIIAHQIDFSRNPLNIGDDLVSYKQIRALVRQEKFDLIHCHTPVASVITRIVAHSEKVKVIYTAHGFHFYTGAPLKNWLIYYPIEWLCSWWTDVLITINKEDYQRAKKKFHAKIVKYVHGAGIDISRFSAIPIDIEPKKQSLGIPSDGKMIISVGELNENKNQKVIINALSKINNKNLYYIIVGQGSKESDLKNQVDKLTLSNQVFFLGYRGDVSELLKCADVFIHPSYREGLPVALMEAMASGTPVICSRIRGNTDLIDYEWCFQPDDVDGLKDLIEKVLSMDLNERNKIVTSNLHKIKKYNTDSVNKKMKEIYNEQ
jgi:glycosyltransferase involved in cell wall biosynthesis